MNTTTVLEYTAQVKKSGLLQGIGSDVWAIPDTVLVQFGTTVFKLLTGGTRVEAVYRALAEAPTNMQVITTMDAMTPLIHLFSPDTPRDVQEYLRDVGNSLNDFAVAITWLETLSLMPTCFKLFEAEKQRREREGLPAWSMSALTKAARDAKEQGVAGVLGYEATFYDFINNLYPGRFPSICEFQAVKTTHNKFAERGGQGLQELRTWAQASVVWTDRRMRSSVFFAALADCFRLFDKMAPDLMDLVPLLARFAAASSGNAGVPFLVQSKDDLK